MDQYDIIVCMYVHRDVACYIVHHKQELDLCNIHEQQSIVPQVLIHTDKS